MNEKPTQHPVAKELPAMAPDTFEAMFRLFTQIGIFWKNLDHPENYRSRLAAFLQNRINLGPIYYEYYKIAEKQINQLIGELGEQQAYEYLFTDYDANIPPAVTNLEITRQKVSNELIQFQLSVGGFKAFGAKNFPGYIGGANIPGEPVPYRTEENK